MTKEILNTTIWSSDDIKVLIQVAIEFVKERDNYYSRQWEQLNVENVSLNIKSSSTPGCRFSYSQETMTFYISSPWSFDSTSPLAAILLADQETWIGSKEAAQCVILALLKQMLGHYYIRKVSVADLFPDVTLRFRPRRISGLDKLIQRKKLLSARLTKSDARFRYEQKRADEYQQKANRYLATKEKTQSTLDEVEQKINKILAKVKGDS